MRSVKCVACHDTVIEFQLDRPLFSFMNCIAPVIIHVYSLCEISYSTFTGIVHSDVNKTIFARPSVVRWSQHHRPQNQDQDHGQKLPTCHAN